MRLSSSGWVKIAKGKQVKDRGHEQAEVTEGGWRAPSADRSMRRAVDGETAGSMGCDGMAGDRSAQKTASIEPQVKGVGRPQPASEPTETRTATHHPSPPCEGGGAIKGGGQAGPPPEKARVSAAAIEAASRPQRPRDAACVTVSVFHDDAEARSEVRARYPAPSQKRGAPRRPSAAAIDIDALGQAPKRSPDARGAHFNHVTANGASELTSELNRPNLPVKRSDDYALTHSRPRLPRPIGSAIRKGGATSRATEAREPTPDDMPDTRDETACQEEAGNELKSVSGPEMPTFGAGGDDRSKREFAEATNVAAAQEAARGVGSATLIAAPPVARPDAKRAHPGGKMIISDKRAALMALLKRREGALTEAQKEAATTLGLGERGEDRMIEKLEGLREAAEADMAADPPLIGKPARYAREVTLSNLPSDHEWPEFDIIILASHTCMTSQVCSMMGLRACSVADRRVVLQPPEGCMHVIAAESEFRACYPHTPIVVDMHLTCSYANFASMETWPDKVRDGSFLQAALEAIDALAWGWHAGFEQPPSGYVHLFGEPDFKLNALDFGDTRFKDIWYWTRNLPGPEMPGRAKRRRKGGPSAAFSSLVQERDPERRMLARSTTSPYAAVALVRAWKQVIDSHKANESGESLQGGSDAAWRAAKMKEVKSNFTTFAASFAPTVDSPESSDRRLIVVIPVAHGPSILVHQPYEGAFGVHADLTGSMDYKAQASKAAEYLSGSTQPFLAGFTRCVQQHAIFVVPVVETITDRVKSTEEWLARKSPEGKRKSGPRSAWVDVETLSKLPSYEWAMMAIGHLRRLSQPTAGGGLRIGAWAGPVPVDMHREASQWRGASANTEASKEWTELIKTDERRGQAISAELCKEDRGDGKLIAWAANVRTVADVATELIPPPQGMPTFESELLRLTEMPRPPPYVSTSWLCAHPPQQLPPGCPREVEWCEVMKPWARASVAQTLNEAAACEIERFDLSAAAAEGRKPRPPHACFGPGAFHLRKHADGIGDYCMNTVMWERAKSGKLAPFDFSQGKFDPRNTEYIREILGGDECTDQELMSFFAEGARFKAQMPCELRILRNVKSLDGRHRAATGTLNEIIDASIIEVMVIHDGVKGVDPDGMFPGFNIPGTIGSSGATDKAGDPLKKRMLVNNTSPNGSAEKPVRAQNTALGAPSGAHVLSLNESMGEKTPGPKRVPANKPAAANTSVRQAKPATAVHAEGPAKLTGGKLQEVIDARPRSSDSDTAPFFVMEERLAGSKQSAQQAVGRAMAACYDQPDKRLEAIAKELTGVHVRRECRGYDGHVLVRAVRRLASRARLGIELIIVCENATYGEMLTGWVNEMAEKGPYHRVPHPFPDPEIKMRPGDAYRGIAVLRHMALVDERGGAEDAFVASATDDRSWMFWQTRTAPCEWPHAQFHLPMARVVAGKERIVYVVGRWLATNMGSRASSKINCRDAEAIMEVWRREMDKIVKVWLQTRSQALRDLLREREEKLGPDQARPFYGDLFTDDHQFHVLGPQLLAKALAVWDRMHSKANIKMCDLVKKGLGTVIDAIGARNVISGGFGVLTPGKRVRVLAESRLAIQGKLSVERYESNNGLLVHAADIANFPAGWSNGLWRPLQNKGWPEDTVHPTGDARKSLEKVIEIVSERAGASFMCAVRDDVLQELDRGGAPTEIVQAASDACTDAAEPAVFGIVAGAVWIFPLDGVWLRKTINVLEFVGTAISAIVAGLIYETEPIGLSGDNTNGLGAMVGRGRASDMQHALESLEESFEDLGWTPRWTQIKRRLFCEHFAGIANEFTDAGSRGKWPVMNAIAASIGLKIHWLDLRDFPPVRRFLQRLLESTADHEMPHPNPPAFTCHACGAPVAAIDHATGGCQACGVPCLRLCGGGRHVSLSYLPPEPLQRPCPTRAPETIFGFETERLTSEQLERGLDGAEVACLRKAYATLSAGEHARLEKLSLEEAATYVLETVVSRQVTVDEGSDASAEFVELLSQGATRISKVLIWHVAALAIAVSRGAAFAQITDLARQVEAGVGRVRGKDGAGPRALTGVMMRAVLPDEYPSEAVITELMRVSRSSITRARKDIAPIWEASYDVIAEVVGAQELDCPEGSTRPHTTQAHEDGAPPALVGLRQGLQLTTLGEVTFASGDAMLGKNELEQIEDVHIDGAVPARRHESLAEILGEDEPFAIRARRDEAERRCIRLRDYVDEGRAEDEERQYLETTSLGHISVSNRLHDHVDASGAEGDEWQHRETSASTPSYVPRHLVPYPNTDSSSGESDGPVLETNVERVANVDPVLFRLQGSGEEGILDLVEDDVGCADYNGADDQLNAADFERLLALATTDANADGARGQDGRGSNPTLGEVLVGLEFDTSEVEGFGAASPSDPIGGMTVLAWAATHSSEPIVLDLAQNEPQFGILRLVGGGVSSESSSPSSSSDEMEVEEEDVDTDRRVCRRAGCSKEVFIECSTGLPYSVPPRIHEFCSRSCAVAARSVASTSVQAICALDGCNHRRFEGKDYCSRTCAVAGGALPPTGASAPPPAGARPSKVAEEEPIFLCNKVAEAFMCLAQHAPTEFIDSGGSMYVNVAQYLAAAKARVAGDDHSLRMIMSHGHEPAEAKRLSQDVKPSGAPVWRQVRAMWMARGIYLKISQNEQARWVLLATGNAPLIEDDPRDAVWGTGTGGGQNLTGKMMGSVRRALREGRVVAPPFVRRCGRPESFNIKSHPNPTTELTADLITALMAASPLNDVITNMRVVDRLWHRAWIQVRDSPALQGTWSAATRIQAAGRRHCAALEAGLRFRVNAAKKVLMGVTTGPGRACIADFYAWDGQFPGTRLRLLPKAASNHRSLSRLQKRFLITARWWHECIIDVLRRGLKNYYYTDNVEFDTRSQARSWPMGVAIGVQRGYPPATGEWRRTLTRIKEAWEHQLWDLGRVIAAAAIQQGAISFLIGKAALLTGEDFVVPGERYQAWCARGVGRCDLTRKVWPFCVPIRYVAPPAPGNLSQVTVRLLLQGEAVTAMRCRVAAHIASSIVLQAGERGRQARLRTKRTRCAASKSYVVQRLRSESWPPSAVNHIINELGRLDPTLSLTQSKPRLLEHSVRILEHSRWSLRLSGSGVEQADDAERRPTPEESAAAFIDLKESVNAWTLRNVERLLPKAIVDGHNYIGFVDARMEERQDISCLKVRKLKERGPIWIGTSTPLGTDQIIVFQQELLKEQMGVWKFPSEFAESQAQAIAAMHLPEGRLRSSRCVLVIAFGHKPDVVADRGPMLKYHHSIAVYPTRALPPRSERHVFSGLAPPQEPPPPNAPPSPPNEVAADSSHSYNYYGLNPEEETASDEERARSPDYSSEAELQAFFTYNEDAPSNDAPSEPPNPCTTLACWPRPGSALGSPAAAETGQPRSSLRLWGSGVQEDTGMTPPASPIRCEDAEGSLTARLTTVDLLERQDLAEALVLLSSQSPPLGRFVPSDGRVVYYIAALQGIRDGVEGEAKDKLLRELAASLGSNNAKKSTLHAMTAVISQMAWPARYARDRDAWELHGAKESNYRKWKAQIAYVARLVNSEAEALPSRPSLRLWGSGVQTEADSDKSGGMVAAEASPKSAGLTLESQKGGTPPATLASAQPEAGGEGRAGTSSMRTSCVASATAFPHLVAAPGELEQEASALPPRPLAPGSTPGSLASAAPSPTPPCDEPRGSAPRQVLPKDGKSARALVFGELRGLLESDISEFAIAPRNHRALEDMFATMQEHILAGIPHNTLKADDNGARKAAAFCVKYDTPFIRPRSIGTGADQAREAVMYAAFVMECLGSMVPRAKRVSEKNGEIITDVKPESALAPLYAWRRILRDGGHELPPIKMVAAVVKGKIDEYKRKWGSRALIPTRRKPFPRKFLLKIEARLQEIRRGDEVLAGWCPERAHAMSTAFKFGCASGVRADEPTHKTDYIKRNAFKLVEGEIELAMIATNFERAKDGWYVKWNAGGSKCDRDSTEWGDRDAWFRLDGTNPLNFGWAWIEWELAYPCPEGERGQWAAFSPNGGAAPYKERVLQSSFQTVVVDALGKEEAAQRSWHSLRVTLATALLARNNPDGAIQCLCRWKTSEAMRIYARMDRKTYADLVEQATTTEIEVNRATALPSLGHDDIVSGMEAATLSLGTEEDPAAGSRQAAAPAAASSAEPQREDDESHSEEILIGAARVKILKRDESGYTGKMLNVANAAWKVGSGDSSWEPQGSTKCKVIGRLAEDVSFDKGEREAAYAVRASDDGHLYVVPRRMIDGGKVAAKRRQTAKN